jgi:hypothetical protein
MLRFPYLPEPLGGPPPPSLPAGATARWRPLLFARYYTIWKPEGSDNS